MSRGFTLVEVMITLVISGVLMTSVYMAFQSQQGSYQAQEQVAEMQQNLRAGTLIMARELRMAGYDGANGTSHSSCNLYVSGSPGVAVSPGMLAVTDRQLDFSMDLNSNGDCADTGENLSYYIYTASDGVDKLGRRDNTSAFHSPPVKPSVQAVAESFEELEFTYLDSTQLATANLADIRSIIVSILAKAGKPDRNYTDSKTYPTTPAGTSWGPYDNHFRRRFQTMTVKCRNMGL